MDHPRDWSAAFRMDSLTVHRDERGMLYEALRFTSLGVPTGGQIYIYSVAPGARRGDHYHAEKGEWFVCAAGSVRLLMKTQSGETVDEILEAGRPQMVYAGPGTSHALVNETAQPAVIVAYASKEFDPAKPDTYAMRSS